MAEGTVKWFNEKKGFGHTLGSNQSAQEGEQLAGRLRRAVNSSVEKIDTTREF